MRRVGLSPFAAMALVASAVGVRAAPVSVDAPAPALVMTALDGRVLDLKQLRGHVIVLNLWASWCPPCRAEMPMLESFYRKHAADGVLVIAASDDELRDRRDVVRAKRGLSFPVALLADARENGFGAPAALPMTFVIDSEGVVRARLEPSRQALTEATLDALVAPLIAPALGAR